ncbi:reverse transcriptase domain-containing protein [Tanacetum coccineum]
MKRLIIELPTLTTLVPKETFYVYLVASKYAVSGVLMVDREGKQTPIRYFEAHPFRVITDQPIKQILNKPEVFGKLVKYDVELGAYNIMHVPRNAIKGQHQRAGLVLIDPTARKMKVQALKVKVDSNLVACQLNDEFMASSEGMPKYLTKAKEHATLLKKNSIKNIPQNQNQKASVLSKLALVAFNHLTKEVLVEVLNTRPVDTQEVNTIVEEEEDNWMTPIIKCLEEGVWPTDENKARILQMKTNQYVMEEGVLFKNSYLSPMLRCVGPLQENYIIREVYEGHAECMPEHGRTRLSKTRLTSIMSPWPFYEQGLDILGPLLEGPDKIKFIIVAIDYFRQRGLEVCLGEHRM